jgi:hypothetical protein
MTDDQQPRNREERRAQRFKKGPRPPDVSRAEPHPGPKEATATSTTQGPTAQTGAGTGGAVEKDGRLPHHEGMHLGNQPNS